MSKKLFVIDTSCFHHLINYAVSSQQLYGNEQIAYIKASYYWANSLGFFPSFRDRSNINVIWAEDSKPYWRSQIYPEYKGKRDDGNKDTLVQNIRIFSSLGFKNLAFPCFEADDIAALLGQMWRDRKPGSKYDELFFCTPDSDWQGLVRIGDQYYLDIGGHSPRVRDKRIIYDWYQRKVEKWYGKRYRLKRQDQHPLKSFEEFTCSDIWHWKYCAGDRSDNLPPFFDESLIDLYNPPDQFNLYQNRDCLIEAQKVLNQTIRPRFNASDSEKVFEALGCTPPVSHILEDDYLGVKYGLAS